MELENVNEIIPEQMGSLVSTLIQALESGDMSTFQFVLEQEDVDIINNTLEGFSRSNLFEKFIQVLLEKLRTSPKHTTQCLRWLDVFLKKKSDFVRSNQNINRQLNSARDLFAVKERLIPTLLRVKGKLAFLLEMRHKRKNPDAYLSEGWGEPLVVVDERESEHIETHSEVHIDKQMIPDEEFEDEEADFDEEEALYEEEYEKEKEENEKEEEEDLEMEMEDFEDESEQETKREHYLKQKNQSRKKKNNNHL